MLRTCDNWVITLLNLRGECNVVTTDHIRSGTRQYSQLSGFTVTFIVDASRSHCSLQMPTGREVGDSCRRWGSLHALPKSSSQQVPLYVGLAEDLQCGGWIEESSLHKVVFLAQEIIYSGQAWELYWSKAFWKNIHFSLCVAVTWFFV